MPPGEQKQRAEPPLRKQKEGTRRALNKCEG